MFGKEKFEESNAWRVELRNQLENICCNYRVKVINPNDYYSFLDDSTYDSQREIMEFDLGRVRNSDLVIVNFNDPNSIGTACELSVAYEKRIPVIGFCESGEGKELHPWLKNMCNKIFADWEDLILYILNYYLD